MALQDQNVQRDHGAGLLAVCAIELGMIRETAFFRKYGVVSEGNESH